VPPELEEELLELELLDDDELLDEDELELLEDDEEELLLGELNVVTEIGVVFALVLPAAS
jgi:hypothetical protein